MVAPDWGVYLRVGGQLCGVISGVASSSLGCVPGVECAKARGLMELCLLE